MIGWVILGLIFFPLFTLMIASVFDTPRSPRVAAMFTGVFLLQLAAMIIGFVIFAWILGFIVP